jgi:hypothetical protein
MHRLTSTTSQFISRPNIEATKAASLDVFLTHHLLSAGSLLKLPRAPFRRHLERLQVDFSHIRHRDAFMRTTLTLDADVAAKARRGAAKLGKPFKSVINSALRIGLDEVLKPPAAKPYRAKSFPMGLKPGFSYDNIGELLAQAEGEDYK